jgi:hypothetical protein
VTLRITYVKKPVDSLGRLHASFRRENPTSYGVDYTFANVVGGGPGHYLGTVLTIQGRPKDASHLEGDETIVQDNEPVRFRGTGTEDYVNSGWYFWGGGSIRPLHGSPVVDGTMSQFTMYRMHLADPVPFRNSLRATMEHGDQNVYQADFSSVAFWYAAPQCPAPTTSAVQCGSDVTRGAKAIASIRVFPNPMSEHCLITCAPALQGRIGLSIYDVSGRVVRSLPVPPFPSPSSSFRWDGKDDQGRPVGSGIYFVRAAEGGSSVATKILLLR